MPRINLLPWREAERKRKRQEFMVGAVGALIAAFLVYVVVNWQMQSAIDDQMARNTYLKDQISDLDKQIAEILDLEEQKQRLQARITVIESLELSRPEIVHVFDQLVRTTPDGIYLTSVKQIERKIELKGVAQSSTRVASYMRNIDSSEWLKDPALQILETKGATDAGSQFTLNATQENPQAAAAPEAGKAPAPKANAPKSKAPRRTGAAS
ncbi:pilus assembly protein PilN [Steroidobacter agaridevorans]|uniref:Pilus assembly protein PilN n=1 Tax=Steroidobacter agaridevorans TaxID=2695856 RepID=A0A829Y521_9GAMM|nr:PilN domain-containing protein [Steroidobacter agaridevorans]GFE78277.1 pilus assembly protein PilN [Steroidobacter agaridevorans]GFE89790.1 pilus assembly protein PilN [Steroidobacter agaridevorans]